MRVRSASRISGSTNAWRETLKICLASSTMSAVFIRWNAFIAVPPSRCRSLSFQRRPKVVTGLLKVGARWLGVGGDDPPQHRHVPGSVHRERADDLGAAHCDDRELRAPW